MNTTPNRKEITEGDAASALNDIDDNPLDALNYIVHYMFAQLGTTSINDPSLFQQMSTKRGINIFGEPAVQALLKEFVQFSDLNVFKGIDPETLTKEQKREALRTLSTIKLKRSKELKGRVVADGRPQRLKYDKSQRSSATYHQDTIMMSLLIDAMEKRCVGTGDVPGTYLHAYIKDFNIIRFEGKMIDIICKINPEFDNLVVIENGKKVLYLRLNKALYGCVVSSLLWYELFSKTLKQMGFEINPYDMCVANKMVNGKQCTIVGYVDDLKVSHEDKGVLNDVLSKIADTFEKLDSKIGNKQTYLVMEVEFNGDRTVSIQMEDYIKEVIATFDQQSHVTSATSTPALQNLFMVDTMSPHLDDKRSEVFHHCVAKLLYVSK